MSQPASIAETMAQIRDLDPEDRSALLSYLLGILDFHDETNTVRRDMVRQGLADGVAMVRQEIAQRKDRK